MPLWNERRLKPQPRSAKLKAEEFVGVFCLVCFLMVPMFLVAAFNAAGERRIVATTPASDAVVDRVFRKPEKGRPLYVSIGFYEAPGSSVICNLDVPVSGDGSDLTVGRTIKIVRTTPGCDVPILVGHVPSVEGLLAFGFGCFACACGLLFFRRYLAGLRRALEPWDGEPA